MYRRARRYIYDVVQSPEVDNRTEEYFRLGIALLIIINVFAVMAATVKDIYTPYRQFFIWLEIFSVAVFSLEYVLRLWVVVEEERYRHPVWGRLRYIFSFYALVDLAAVLPFYLPLLTKVDLRMIRALRLLRLVRLLKLGRYSKSAQRFATVFRKQREQLVLSLMVLLLLLVLSSTLVFFFEQGAQPEVFSSIPASLWWGIVTLTTIGYGDVYPITVGGKICAAVISVLSVGLVALPSGIIVAGFVAEIENRGDEDEEKRCPHCGEKLN